MFAEARVRLWMVALAVLALLVSGLVWQQQRQQQSDRATRSATATCPDLRLVLVPGNAQGTSTDAGPALNRFASRFTTVLAGRRTVARIVVPNPSRPATVFNARFPNRPANQVISSRQVRGWETGMNVAADRALRALTTSIQSCPNTGIVIAGYSQGAGAVHRALTKVATGSPVQRRILGTVLLGDPDRRAATRALSQYRPRTNGIEYTKRLRISDVPSAKSPVTTYSVCLPTDLVCAFGGQRIRSGVSAHSRYSALTSAYDTASRGIVDVALGIPLIPGYSYPMTGIVGDQFLSSIPVRIPSNLKKYLYFTPTTALPPGLQMSTSGLVTGIPTTAGVTKVGYRVQNTAARKYGLPVSGSLTITIKASQGLRVSSGGESQCVVRLNHALNCWGANGYGQLGDGTKADKRSPLKIGTGSWNEVATSGTHTCGIRTSLSIWCWGNNRYGQIGNGTQTESLRPTQVAAFAAWRTVSVNNFNTCAITTGSTLWCWGNNNWGQLGVGSTTTSLRPKSLGTGWTSVSVGYWNVCATKTGGQLWCWGANDFGQVGDGTKSQRTAPVRIGPNFSWTGVSVGSMHACALLTSGYLRCWGTNITGQLGTGDTTAQSRPAPVYGSSVWRGVSVGDLFTCGIKADNSVWCWGTGALGQRGSGVRSSSATPVRITGATTGARISSAWTHTCVAESATEGSMSCWGFNNRGQIGDGTNTWRIDPWRVTLP